ncbi:MAG: hypothetical protein MJ138_06385 [Kiritimatiellae bacterium]|nr:hypothetical protein [Kiritimatiellia bacterium]
MGDLIQTAPELEAACAKARAEGLLALDTEFVWRRTYRPQLGIVQIGCRAGCWALDCMCGMNTDALRELVEDAAVVKIFHDAHQDLAHLRHYTGCTPRNVFDTQLAAAFAGFPSAMGLQKLLLDAIGVGLPKTETCTDWTQRPLSAAQVKYALDDVRHLPDLRDELLKRADAFGTRAWLEEDMRRYDGAEPYEDAEPGLAWKRVKTGRARLDGRGWAILRAVAALREETAMKWNLPRNWLGDDESLAEMAEAARVGRLRHRLRGGQAETIRALYAAAVERAAQTPESEWPENPKPHYIAEVKAAADEAVAWLAERADALHVAPGAIANRATVTAFVDDVGDDSNPLASGWRFEAVGREMAERFGVD